MENLNTQISELFDAVRRSDIRKIKRLLAANVSPTQRGEDGQTPLSLAAQIGNAQVIQMLCLSATSRLGSAQIFFHTDIDSTNFPLLPALNNTDETSVTLPGLSLIGQDRPSPVYYSAALPGVLSASLSDSTNDVLAADTVVAEVRSPQAPAPRSKTPPQASLGTPFRTTFQKSAEPLPSPRPSVSPAATAVPAATASAARATNPSAPKPSRQALEQAVRCNDVESVRALLKAGVDFRPRHWYDVPLLVTAAEHGYSDVAQALIDAGANVHIGYDQLPLHAAASKGHLDVVQRLLNSGAHIHAETDGGRTALMEAAAGGHFLVAELLVAGGANVNASCRGETALMLAAKEQHRAVYELLYPLVQPAGRVPFPQSMKNALQLNLQVQ